MAFMILLTICVCYWNQFEIKSRYYDLERFKVDHTFGLIRNPLAK